MQPINIVMIYDWDKRSGDHLEHIVKKDFKKYILWARHQINVSFF